MTDLDLDHLKTWIGRQECVTDTLDGTKASELAAILDHERLDFTRGQPLPMGWQWIYFNPILRSSDLDEDGHPRRGDFLPPVPFPRRMWASGKIVSHQPLLIGIETEKQSSIKGVSLKEGKSGPLLFVDVAHAYWQEGATRLEEVQNIVFREVNAQSSVPKKSPPAPRPSEFSRAMSANEVLLFRYSAVTFNAHRIHHDEAYATEVEGYRGLVVHGPLLATMLIDFAMETLNITGLEEFQFRALRPLFANDSFHLHGRRDGSDLDLWICDDAGYIIMEARARLGNESI